jgi:glycosyltransferase involved in cell wall biosynthesis
MRVVPYDLNVKTIREEKPIEHSMTSINVLSDRLDHYFSARGLELPWYPDNYTCLRIPSNQSIQNIVLFGGFLKSFLESGNWPIDTGARFWCLSSRVQKIFQKVLDCGDNFISVIPRYDLFPQKKEERRISTLNLVFAGRLSESKNIKLLLAVYRELEKQAPIECSLDLYGLFDDGYSYNYGRRKRDESYETDLRRYISKKDWLNPPRIHGWKESKEWLNDSRNKTYITLSEFACEDFGVSVAQAQENGMPTILSDWGGHADVYGRVLKIPSSLLCHGIESEVLLETKAQIIAHYILENLDNLNAFEIKSVNQFNIPRTILPAELDQKRRQLFTNYGMDLLFTHRIGFDFYADTDSGSRFFSQYNKIFGNNFQRNDAVFILNDIDGPNEIMEEVIKVQKICLEEGFQFVDFISLRYLFRIENIESIILASRVYMKQGYSNYENIYRKITEIRPDIIFF